MVRTDVQPASWWLAGLPRSSSSRPRLEASTAWLHLVALGDERWRLVRFSVARQQRRPPARRRQPWAEPPASVARVHARAALADLYGKPA